VRRSNFHADHRSVVFARVHAKQSCQGGSISLRPGKISLGQRDEIQGKRYLLPNVLAVTVATTKSVCAISVTSVESVGFNMTSTMYMGAMVKFGVTL